MFVPALTSRPVTALASRFFGRGIPIFTVHRLELDGTPPGGTKPGHLRCCLEYLDKAGYTTVSLEDVIQFLLNQTALPDKPVVFTMDDGFVEQADVAASIFLEYECPLTFFVITDMLDKDIWPWDAKVSWIINNTKIPLLKIEVVDEIINLEITDTASREVARQKLRDIIKEMDAAKIDDTLNRLSEAANVPVPVTAPSAYQPINWQIASRLEQKGIRFAPHSKTHRILSKLSDQSAMDEITGSWEALNRELSNPLNVFCYPTGRLFDFGPREIAYLRDAGFLGAVSSQPRLVDVENHTQEQIFSLPRVPLPDSMTYFIQCCSWIEHVKRGRAISPS